MASNLSRTSKKISRKLLFLRKELSHRIEPKRAQRQALLFIIGCQRSGTTLMTEILEKDWDARVYPEHSRLSAKDRLDGLRLNPLSEVRETILQTPYPLVVLKPLVETQNADRLLDYFPQAKAVWMYRHYKDVAASNLKRFGPQNGIKNLGYIAREDHANWRAERLSAETRQIVSRFYAPDMNPHDAAALFWYVRNTFYFERGLDAHDRVMICRYADLVTSPEETLRAIYAFLQSEYPGDHILADVHTSSVGRGQGIQLSEAVEAVCVQMWARLEAEARASAFAPAKSAEALL